MGFRLLAALALAPVLLAPTLVRAGVPGPIFVYTYCGIGETDLLTCSSPFGTATADPGTTIAASVSTGLNPNVNSNAILGYDMALNYSGSGSPSNSVPLLITAHGWATATDQLSSATSSVRIGSNPLGFACAGSSFDCRGEKSSFAVTLTSFLPLGVYRITLTASTGASSGGHAAAFADPYVQIDPNFLAANPGYSLSFSEGVVNAVPEPASGLLMLAGLALLASKRRRR